MGSQSSGGGSKRSAGADGVSGAASGALDHDKVLCCLGSVQPRAQQSESPCS